MSVKPFKSLFFQSKYIASRGLQKKMASEDFDAYDLPTASPPKPHQGHKKTWQELRNAAREIRFVDILLLALINYGKSLQ